MLVASLCTCAGIFIAWQRLVHAPVKIRDAKGYTLVVAPGTSLQKLTRQLYNDNLIVDPSLLCWYGMAKGFANNLKAGEYLIKPTDKAAAVDILHTVVDGKVAQYAFTIVEGWRSKDVIAALQQNPKIKSVLKDLSEEQLIAELGIKEKNIEGIFLPDTYYFPANTTDKAFLLRAYNNMQKKLQAAWEKRANNLAIKDPYEALILASIIEKESAYLAEYPEISGVYQRRLVKRMRLQADPTVIYGLGANFNGQLFKNQLKLDTVYNTYTRYGLPPTPIAIPSMAALEAALHPKDGDSLYFVATNEGRHVFSKTLLQHNQAISKK